MPADGKLLKTIGSSLGEFRSYVDHVGQKRYYSSTDAVVYLGNKKLSEVVSIKFTIQEPKMPLYGYNSWVFDEVAIGSRIISGDFIINFTIPDYLYQVSKTGEESDTKGVIYSNNGTEEGSDHYNRFQYMPQNFSIQIYYGNKSANDSITGTTPGIVLEGVHLQNAGQIVGADGEPIFEQYSFIAKDSHYIR